MARYLTGMGKLFRKRKNGHHVGNLLFKYQGRDINTGTRESAAGEQFRRKFLAEAVSTPKSTTNLLIDDLLELVQADYHRRRLRTQDRLESRIHQIKRIIGGVRAKRFRCDDVEDYIDEREDQGVSAATINRELETIRRGFRLAKERELLVAIPKVTLLTADNVRDADLTPDEYESLIRVLRQPVRLMTIIGYYIGWRAGRIKTLVWPQVDFDGGLIRPPKSQAHNKWVGAAPIYGEMRNALLVAYADHEKHWPTVDYVLHRTGQPLLTYRAEWERARKLIGRPDLRFHDLKHAAVTNMIEAGIDETRVMAIVGHKTVAMLKRYRIVADRHTIEAGRMLEAYHERVRPTEHKESVH